MARRYQKGSVILKGTREPAWHYRTLEEPDASGHRVHRSIRLGSVAELPDEEACWQAVARLRGNEPVSAPPVPSSNGNRKAITFEAFAEKWQASVLPQHKPSSQNSERVHLRMLSNKLGDVALADLDGERLQGFVTGLQCSPKYARNITATLRCLWKSARAWGYVHNDPLASLRLPARDCKQQPSFTAEQAKQIIAASKEPYRTMFWVAAETGIRGGELCGLGVQDVDFATRTILVQRSAWNGVLQSPKTGNAIRCFPISEQLASHLQEFLHTHWRANADRLLFLNERGRVFNNKDVVRIHLHPLTRRLGIPAGGLHAFRHCNATELDSLGVPTAVRMERLGHAQFTTTLRYTHALSEDHRRVASLLGQKFCPNLPQSDAIPYNTNEVQPQNVGA